MFEFSMNIYIYMSVLGTIFVKLNLTLDNKIVLYCITSELVYTTAIYV